MTRCARYAALTLVAAIGVGAPVQAAPTLSAPTTASTPTLSSAGQTDALLQKVHAQLRTDAVVKGRFEQLKTVQGFKQPLRSSGEFVVAQSKGIVWQVQQPFASTLVATPESLQSRGADGAVSMQMQASDEPVLRTVNAMLFAVMSANVAQLREMFEVSGQADQQGWKLHLKPRDVLLAQWLQSIDLQGHAFVQKVQLQETRGDRSEIRIHDAAGSAHLSAADAARFP